MLTTKTIALDLGDKWVGIAIADATGITCKPLTTIILSDLLNELPLLIKEHTINRIIVGLPKTFSGTASDQTKKIISTVKELKKNIESQGFVTVQWKLWDERLSSKRAQHIGKKKPSFEERKKEHARAAAFILQSYLDSLAFEKENNNDSTQEL